MTARPIRLGTRRSALARTQSGLIADRLRELTGREVELVNVTTEGDTNRAPLTSMGGAGVFVSAVRGALTDGTVDVVVHSLKDLPTTPEPGIRLAAVPRRADPRDALVSAGGKKLVELPAGAVIGTGSPRRHAQLKALGLGFDVVDIRGNVETRMGYVTSGRLDAVVLAMAGLERLGKQADITEKIDPINMLPAPGQGALAVETRDESGGAVDDELVRALAEIDDADTRSATTAERAVLAETGAGCSAPLGALAEIVEDEDGPALSLRAALCPEESIDDGDVVRLSVQGGVADADRLGRELAIELLDRLSIGEKTNDQEREA
ncbi:hydroxymethylbilane synthase [Spelaeicoccus albus]|uniref:Porphobilinogen deaminase n=1 Tax=Spelaeicoccus albus TaxID=1280376 RepID=A0A7Z0D5R2_9MICO|nr:hydroxymethylbilane synthase [Spelaeicoccus albus]NYI69389.1 hydroxymethylbilane synthase [Spelaeicoccus albus]